MIATVVAGAALAGAFGPRFTQPTSRAAGAPFSYTPPAEFVAAEPAQLAAIQATSPSIRAAWVVPSPSMVTSRPSVNVLHAPRMAGVETSDLEALADGMPALLEGTGGTWRTERIARETRADGTAVGWIEGACTKGELAYRCLELVFPDDEGTSFVTATLPDGDGDSEGGRWDAEFLASLQGASGVARRVGAAPVWMHLAWAAGGALLMMLASGIATRRKSRVPPGASIPAPPMPLYERTDASEP